MSASYNIMFINKRGQGGDYAFFSAPPVVNSDVSSSKVFTNIWVSSYVDDQGTFSINTSVDFYGWAGTIESTPVPGTSVQTASSRLVTIGSSEGAGSTLDMVLKQGKPTLQVNASPGGAPGAFAIATGNDFTTPNKSFLIGCGKVDPALGIVRPTATIFADNNSVTQIQPIMKFYVSTSSYVAGQMVNFASASRLAGLIDFSTGPGLKFHSVIITHENDGSFTTKYLPSMAAQLDEFRDKHLRRSPAAIGRQDSNLTKENKELKDEVVRLRAAVKALTFREGPSSIDVTAVITALGTIQWPAAITAIAVAAAITQITNRLISNGYFVKWTKTSQDGTSTDFEIGTRGAAPGRAASISDAGLESAWGKAVGTVPGAINLGLHDWSSGPASDAFNGINGD